jgi:hypothetical protein
MGDYGDSATLRKLRRGARQGRFANAIQRRSKRTTAMPARAAKPVTNATLMVAPGRRIGATSRPFDDLMSCVRVTIADVEQT